MSSPQEIEISILKMSKELKFINYYVSLYTKGETYRFTSHRSFSCHISFVSVRSVLSLYHADVNPMSGYCLPTVYDAEPTLAQYRVTVSCLTPRCMWACVKDGGPTLTQFLFKASCRYYSQHEVSLLTMVEWILASTCDAGPTFIRHWVGIGLHCLTRKHEALNQCWFYAGPASQTVGRNWTSIGSTSRV